MTLEQLAYIAEIIAAIADSGVTTSEAKKP